RRGCAGHRFFHARHERGGTGRGRAGALSAPQRAADHRLCRIARRDRLHPAPAGKTLPGGRIAGENRGIARRRAELDHFTCKRTHFYRSLPRMGREAKNRDSSSMRTVLRVSNPIGIVTLVPDPRVLRFWAHGKRPRVEPEGDEPLVGGFSYALIAPLPSNP